MYDQIIHGREERSDLNTVKRSGMANYKNVALPTPTSSTSRDSSTFLLPEVDTIEVEPFQSTRCTKKRQLSTDSGVELKYHDTSSGGPELGDREVNIDTHKFKSTEQDGNYISDLETFNELRTDNPDTFTISHMGNYVRPETLEWDNRCVTDGGETVDNETCHQDGCNASLSTDSGHDDKDMQSNGVSAEFNETEQDLQFNSDGYLTSPVC